MKKLFSIIAIVAILATVGLNFIQNQDEIELSELALANIEALAQYEDGSSTNWDCWSQEKSGSGYWRCGPTCRWIDGKGGKGDSGKCYKN